MLDIDFIREQEKATQDGGDVSVQDKVKAAKRTDKEARDFFATSGDEIAKME